ncbi:MAG: hypothetical protein ACKOA3_04145 [Sphingomonadales bacterium]|nr:hypothetical protein [Sphingomonadales bacterium]
MKKIISAIFLTFLFATTRAQDQRSPDLYHCLSVHPGAQSLVKPYLEQFLLLDAQLEVDVRSLIESEFIKNHNGLLYFTDLASVVRTAETLEQLDRQYDAFFASAASVLADRFASEGICRGSMDPDVYRELVLNYFETEVFLFKDDRASTLFATQLNFESARVIMNKQEAAWLSGAGEELTGEHPGENQPVTEEFYWPLLNRNFDLELTDPEPALLQMAAVQKEKNKLKDILQFIFNNWTEIKGILDWLTNNLFYDCKPSVTARVRTAKEGVPASLSPGARREFRYAVSQNGVLMDGKSTRTRIKASLKLFKKRPVGWARDKVSLAGINYCSLQWNACEALPWPANGIPFFQAANHQPFKSTLNQQHPYALTIRDVNYEFLTFKLFFNQRAIKTIYLLGSGECE